MSASFRDLGEDELKEQRSYSGFHLHSMDVDLINAPGIKGTAITLNCGYFRLSFISGCPSISVLVAIAVCFIYERVMQSYRPHQEGE